MTKLLFIAGLLNYGIDLFLMAKGIQPSTISVIATDITLVVTVFYILIGGLDG